MNLVQKMAIDRKKSEKSFCDLLKKYRVDARLTQTELAVKLGVTQSYLS